MSEYVQLNSEARSVTFLLTDGTRRPESVAATETIGEVKARLFADEIADGKRVKLIAKGKLLTDETTVDNCEQ